MEPAPAFVVRPLEDRDLAAVAAITNHYIRTTAAHFGSDAVTADELRAQWRDAAATHPWFVAAAGEAVLGYAKAGSWRARAAYRWTAESGVYLAPEHRGRGVGAALYAALLDELRRRGFRSVVAGITLPNPASVRLHERFGFVAVGVVRDAGCKFDAWHDVGFWQLHLGGAGPAPGRS